MRTKKIVSCPLRKVCVICGEEFGRKLMTSGRGKGCFASVKLFEKKQTCGKKCGAKLAAQTRSAEYNALRPKNLLAMDMFLGMRL